MSQYLQEMTPYRFTEISLMHSKELPSIPLGLCIKTDDANLLVEFYKHK